MTPYRVDMNGHLNIAAAFSVLLASCGQSQSNPKICSTYIQPPSTRIIELRWSDKLDLCLHKWSYRLSQSSEPAPIVAVAAIGACKDALDGRITEKFNDDVKSYLSMFNNAVDVARKTESTPPPDSVSDPKLSCLI